MAGQNSKSEIEYLTPDEVAEILKIHRNTVVRRFAQLPGVVNLGVGERRHKRRYSVLRIPRHVLERFIAANRVSDPAL